VLFAMDNPELKKKISQVTSETSSPDMKEIIAAITDSDAIDRSIQISDRYLQKGFTILNELPRNKARSTLSSIAKYIGKRKF
jgi:heptaprenyl diphosphate synthase